MPKDDEFYNDFLRYVETKPDRARYILGELEKTAYRNAHAGQLPELVPWEGLTLEHVFPKNPSNDWSNELSTDPDLREQVHRFGNLCLLPDQPNRAVGSSGFTIKAGTLYANSDLLLTSAIAQNFTQWSQQSIAARQQELARLAQQTWRLT